MIELKRLDTEEQLQSLKKGDTVVVEWNESASEYKRGNEIAFYKKIWGLNHSNEVILQARNNVYFSIDMYLKGESVAKNAYVIQFKEE